VLDPAPIQGDLQAQVMAALWRVEAGNVERIRSELPGRYRSSYNTVQTVLNRLAERGLVARQRAGRSIVYRPRLSEAEYLSGTIQRTLEGASSQARSAALARLVSGLREDELAGLQALAKKTKALRKQSR
jgi:predicted transcriptional regulator